MSDSKVNKELMIKLEAALAPFPEAIDFALAYRSYIHSIDDLIDNPNRPTAEEILKVTAIASALFTHNFWRQYGPQLLAVEQMINNTYADSVMWESDALEHKRTSSDTLRHSGLDMFYSIILVTLGRDKLREFSAPFRQQCHEIQGAK